MCHYMIVFNPEGEELPFLYTLYHEDTFEAYKEKFDRIEGYEAHEISQSVAYYIRNHCTKSELYYPSMTVTILDEYK